MCVWCQETRGEMPIYKQDNIAATHTQVGTSRLRHGWGYCFGEE
jgi:hypothetical protein